MCRLEWESNQISRTLSRDSLLLCLIPKYYRADLFHSDQNFDVEYDDLGHE